MLLKRFYMFRVVKIQAAALLLPYKIVCTDNWSYMYTVTYLMLALNADSDCLEHGHLYQGFLILKGLLQCCHCFPCIHTMYVIH